MVVVVLAEVQAGPVGSGPAAGLEVAETEGQTDWQSQRSSRSSRSSPRRFAVLSQSQLPVPVPVPVSTQSPVPSPQSQSLAVPRSPSQSPQFAAQTRDNCTA